MTKNVQKTAVPKRGSALGTLKKELKMFKKPTFLRKRGSALGTRKKCLKTLQIADTTYGKRRFPGWRPAPRGYRVVLLGGETPSKLFTKPT